MDSYETVILVKQEVFVYKIPPRTTNRGYRAADWKLDIPDWTGRMRIVSKGKECVIKLEDKITGELFAESPIDKYPGIAIESVTDSSRYFVLRIQDHSGRAAFIGIGFADRGDSFDLNVALQEHFKWLQKSEEIEQEGTVTESKPNLDLSFKDGETITINMNIGKKSGSSKVRSKGTSAGTPGLLPPPPGGLKIPPSTVSKLLSEETPSKITAGGTTIADKTKSNLLMDLESPVFNPPASSTCPSVNQTLQGNDLWSDFTTATVSSSTQQNPAPSDDWINF